jgi:hypothetical protein
MSYVLDGRTLRASRPETLIVMRELNSHGLALRQALRQLFNNSNSGLHNPNITGLG